MNKDKLFDAVGEISGEYIEKYAEPCAKTRERRSLPRRAWFAIAACIALAVGLGVGTYVYAEGAEYKKASLFFAENGLSTEGLSRYEVRAVYKDITTESFTYNKTAEVIAHNLGTVSVPGWSFENNREELDSETAKALWEAYQDRFHSTGVRYYTSIKYIEHEGGWNEEKGTYIEKYDGRRLVWRTDLDGFYSEDFRACGDGLIVSGAEYDADFHPTSRLVRIDGSGNVIWNIICGSKGEHICSVLVEDDGSFTLFQHPSHGNTGYWFTRISADGRVLGRELFELENRLVTRAVHYHDGYLVQLFNAWGRGKAEFVLLNRDGELTDEFTYTSEDEYWFVNDMTEFEGRIYLSVDAMPKEGAHVSEENPEFITQRGCLAPAIQYAFEHWQSDGSAAFADIPGLTEKVRERFTALLLVLDSNGGEPTVFWSAEGSSAGLLTNDGRGELIWDTQEISFVEFSPATNAFTFVGTCRTVRYSFLADGTLKERTETDDMSKMYW